MKTYWRLLKFGKPIEKYAIPYFFYIACYAIFNMMIFALLMPTLNTLFDAEKVMAEVTEMPKFALNSEYLNELLNYMLYRVFGADYSPLDVLIFLAGAISVCALFSNLAHYLSRRTMEHMKVRTLFRLRNATFDNVLNLNLGFFSNERKGDIISKITSDVQVVQYCVSSTLQIAFREPFLIIAYLTLMINISWSLTFFAIIYLPLVAGIIGAIIRRLRSASRLNQQNFGEMTSTIDETLTGMKIIKGYNAEGFFMKRFNDVNTAYSRTWRKITRKQQLASPLSEFLGIIAVAGLLIFGGHLVMNGTLNPGGFIAYIGVFTQITRPVKSFAEAFSNINQGIAAGDRVLELLDTPSSITDRADAKVLTRFEERIEFRDVRFSYENKEVLKGINFTIEKGQTVALVGPSGGGKSTISDLIPRFYDVLGGSITLDGTDIRDYTLHSLRSVMGIVSQDTILFNDTIENNIRLGNDEATMEQVIAAAKVANAHDFILQTEHGYKTNIGDRGMKLSGGQRQRLSIARAVLKNPPLLILDEATSALDTESEKLVQESLNTLLQGRTSLVIAHRLSTIYNADKIIVVEGGRIVEEGTHQELIKNGGLYHKLVEMQHLV